MFNFYGFFISLGILAGILVIEKIKPLLNKKYLISQVNVDDIFPWVLIFGLIGARLYHIIDYWQYYSQNIWQIFYLWQGGLGIFGGILGGIIGLWIFSRIKYKKLKINKKDFFLLLLDLLVIGLALGQAIGRWGNYFNQELYGLPTSLPWAIYIQPENRLAGYETFSRFQPLFLYESLGCLLIFFFLLFLLKLKEGRLKPGKLFFSYLGLYSFLRFWLEFLRIRHWMIKGIVVNQAVCLGLIMISVYNFFLFDKK